MKAWLMMGCVGLIGTSQVAVAASSEFGCMLRPMQTVEVRSPVVGRITAIYANRGDHVTKGQVLARLDSSVEQAAANTAKFRAGTQASVTAARNKVASAQKKVERMQVLYEANFMSGQALDDAKNELHIAEGELQAATESKTQASYEYASSMAEVNRRTIVSPLSGTVTARYVDVGATVSPTDGKYSILTLAQTDRLKVQVIAPIKYFNQIHKGSRLTITPEKPFDRPLSMTVAIKDKSVDAASGTFSAIGYVNNQSNRVPSGVLCSVGF